MTKEEILSIHDLTRRSTSLGIALNGEIVPFNSRPHKEVDVPAGTGRKDRSLSIHDLTRRSTVPDDIDEELPFSFNSRPHKEVDVETE